MYWNRFSQQQIVALTLLLVFFYVHEDELTELYEASDDDFEDSDDEVEDDDDFEDRNDVVDDSDDEDVEDSDEVVDGDDDDVDDEANEVVEKVAKDRKLDGPTTFPKKKKAKLSNWTGGHLSVECTITR